MAAAGSTPRHALSATKAYQAVSVVFALARVCAARAVCRAPGVWGTRPDLRPGPRCLRGVCSSPLLPSARPPLVLGQHGSASGMRCWDDHCFLSTAWLRRFRLRSCVAFFCKESALVLPRCLPALLGSRRAPGPSAPFGPMPDGVLPQWSSLPCPRRAHAGAARVANKTRWRRGGAEPCNSRLACSRLTCYVTLAEWVACWQGLSSCLGGASRFASETWPGSRFFWLSSACSLPAAGWCGRKVFYVPAAGSCCCLPWRSKHDGPRLVLRLRRFWGSALCRQHRHGVRSIGRPSRRRGVALAKRFSGQRSCFS